MTAKEYFYNHWQKANRERFGDYGDYDSDEYAIAFATDYAAFKESQTSCLGGVSGSKTWLEQQEETMLKRMQEQVEYLFVLTHYDWMYRATGDKKYLDEQLRYIEKYKAKFNYL